MRKALLNKKEIEIKADYEESIESLQRQIEKLEGHIKTVSK